MAGRTPREAVRNFVDPLQRTLACVTQAVANISGGYYPSETPHSLVLGAGEPVRLRGAARMRYRIVEPASPRGRWDVNIVAYQFTLWDRDGQELVAYHWHPDGESDVVAPHIHLGSGAAVGHAGLREAHLPTGIIALENVLYLAPMSLGAEPLRRDWRTILDTMQAAPKID